MARIDDYSNAFKIALEELKTKDLRRVADAGGAVLTEVDGAPCLEIPFIDRLARITMPDGEFSDLNAEGEIPIQERVLILHYLNSATGRKPSNDWIAYREVPDGSFYYQAFVSRAINPLKGGFGENPDLLRQVAPLLKGEPIAEGDVGFLFKPFPHTPIKLILWQGDDEFPPEGNILLDRSIIEYLSAEDIAWVSGMVVYRLMGLARQKSK